MAQKKPEDKQREAGDAPDDETSVEQAAEQAVEHGNHPFGALLVKAGEVILTAENAVNTENDVTRHAELVLVSRASKAFTPEVLAQCTLYTSTEPCAMCLGAIPWSGVRSVICGARDEDARAIGFDEGSKPDDWIKSLKDRGIGVCRDRLGG